MRVNVDAIPAYAASLPDPDPPPNPAHPDAPPNHHAAAFWLTLDAINFGSGWFPTLHKRPGQTGYRTIEAGLKRRFDTHGPWTAEQLQQITAAEIADTLSQDPTHELMGLFARSLNDLGLHVTRDYDGRFEAVPGSSAEALVERLAGWACFEDTSTYDGLEIPFLKRAQIAAADLTRANVADFHDLDRLTLFADNLVPHVLRLDGILTFDTVLLDQINTEQLIAHGSPEEIEIRACALHAVELIVARRPGATAAATDQRLWLRGQQPRYKAVPRHRSRSTAY